MVMVINGSGISGLDGSTSAPTLQGTDTNTGIYFPALDTVGVVTNGTERLRVDSSGNVGIGATSLSTWGVGSNPTLTIKGTNSNYPGRGGALTLASQDGLSNVSIANDTGLQALQFYIGATERMRIDSNGSVGIGTSSPSSYVSPGQFVNYNSGSAALFAVGGTVSSYLFSSSSGGIGAVGTSSNHVFGFYTNGSERMRIDTSGKVGIGTSSPGYLQHNYSGTENDVALALSSISNSSTAGSLGLTTKLRIGALGSANNNGVAEIRGLHNLYQNSLSTLTFLTNDGSALAERMRIDSSGNLGIGTTSPSTHLHISKASVAEMRFTNTSGTSQNMDVGTQTGLNAHYIYCYGSYPLLFATNGSEKMRIDASGSLIIGDTGISAGNERVRIKSNGSTSSTAGIQIINFAGTELFFVRSDGAFRTGSASVSPYNNTVGSGANLFVNTDGTLLRSTSSLKYKTDVNDATHGLADVMNLRSVTYKGKNNEVDGDNIYGGLIAEEVHEAGLTEFIQYAEDGTPDGIYYGNMVGLLVKAIQELKAEFDAYKASHP